jgi:hypothetical protein
MQNEKYQETRKNLYLLKAEGARSQRPQVLEYSDEPKKMGALLDQVKVLAKYIGLKKFGDEPKTKPVYTFEITLNRDGQSVAFNYHCSIAQTYELDKRGNPQWLKPGFQRCLADLLYSALACVRSEYHCPLTFKEFAEEFGYDGDSIKAKTLWEKCLEQSDKLQRIFTETEANYLPA